MAKHLGGATWTAAFFQVAGLLMIGGGLCSIAWGNRRLDEPPIPRFGYRVATTQQIEAICMGGMAGLLGLTAYRHGRSLSDNATEVDDTPADFDDCTR